MLFIKVSSRGGGGYSSMIWVGTCLWDLKSRPIFIPNFAEKWDPFLYQSHKFYAKITKNFTLFSKIVKLSSKFRKFWYQIWWNWAYFCANFRKFWKYDPCLYQFLHWIRGHLYTRRLILRPISAACPRIDLCTKNPPPRGLILLSDTFEIYICFQVPVRRVSSEGRCRDIVSLGIQLTQQAEWNPLAKVNKIWIHNWHDRCVFTF